MRFVTVDRFCRKSCCEFVMLNPMWLSLIFFDLVLFLVVLLVLILCF